MDLSGYPYRKKKKKEIGPLPHAKEVTSSQIKDLNVISKTVHISSMCYRKSSPIFYDKERLVKEGVKALNTN